MKVELAHAEPGFAALLCFTWTATSMYTVPHAEQWPLEVVMGSSDGRRCLGVLPDAGRSPVVCVDAGCSCKLASIASALGFTTWIESACPGDVAATCASAGDVLIALGPGFGAVAGGCTAVFDAYVQSARGCRPSRQVVFVYKNDNAGAARRSAHAATVFGRSPDVLAA